MRAWAYGLACATLTAASVVTGTLAGFSVPVRIPLAELPFALAGWSGHAEPISPEFLTRTRPDDVLHRRYVDNRGREIVVYVAHYVRDAGQGQVLAQCPVDCLVVDAATEALEVAGRAAVVNRAEVVQNGVPMVVLYWFEQGQRIFADPYRGKVEQARRAFRERRTDGTVIRISAPVIASVYEARERAVAFARVLVPVLLRHLPE